LIAVVEVHHPACYLLPFSQHLPTTAPIKWNQGFLRAYKFNKNRQAFSLFIARVCPAAGEPDLKTSPPIKRKHHSLFGRH
jgi:hypothetical protein